MKLTSNNYGTHSQKGRTAEQGTNTMVRLPKKNSPFLNK